MPNFAGQRTLGAASVSVFPLAGTVYEFIPNDSQVEVGLSVTVTGPIASIGCDQEIVLQDVGEANIIVKATAPVYPDDFFYSFSCLAGSRLVLGFRNPGAASVLFYAGKITEV